MRKNLAKGVLLTGLALGGAKAAHDGINEGWFFHACDKSYAAVRQVAPENVRNFIDRHPVYTAGLEGLGAGFLTGAAAGAAGMAFYKRKERGVENE